MESLFLIFPFALLAPSMADLSVHTGGGAAVDGDANLGGGDFVGHDKRTSVEGGLQINFHNERPGYGGGGHHNRRKATPEEITERLLVLIDGSADLGVVGMRTRIRQLWAVVVVMAVSMLAMLGLQIMLVAEYLSRGGG